MYPMAVCLSICQRVYLSAVCSLYPFSRTKHYVKNNKEQHIINAIICVHRLAPQLPSFTAFRTNHIFFLQLIVCFNMTIQFQFNVIINL